MEREAEDFDEEAVEQYLSERPVEPEPIPMACGCPSTQIQTFIPSAGSADATTTGPQTRTPSALGQWPVQINLIPANAPFLKGARSPDCR